MQALKYTLLSVTVFWIGFSFVSPIHPLSNPFVTEQVFAATAEENAKPIQSDVEFIEVHTVPSLVKAGDPFRIEAVIMNASPYPIRYHAGCDSSISAVFDGNVEVEHVIGCLGFTTHELKSEERATVVGPSSDVIYRASSLGTTGSVVTFTYEVQNETRSASKRIYFAVEGFSDSIPAQLGLRFQLKINQTALLETENILVKFTNILEDSRCPADVVCVHEGQATILVNTMRSLSGTNITDLTLTNKAGAEDLGIKTFDRHKIRFVKIEPYPYSNETIKPSDYIATFVVSHSAESVANSDFMYLKSWGGKENRTNDNYKLLVTRNLEEQKGLIILFEDGNRKIWRSTFSDSDCNDLINFGKCIKGSIYSDKNQDITNTLHMGINDWNSVLTLKLLGNDERKIVFSIKELRSEVFIKIGERYGPLQVLLVLPYSVTAVNFVTTPVATEDARPITLGIGESASNGCSVRLTLKETGIGVAKFLKIVEPNRQCPICLSGDTLIDTPNGPVNIKKLEDGMTVWTLDNLGHKQTTIILKTGKTLVASTHTMIHMVLDDGRELLASVGHPTADGRLFGDITEGDSLDNSHVKSIESVTYNETYTYDILPSGSTGFYWANGIIVGSTLR